MTPSDPRGYTANKRSGKLSGYALPLAVVRSQPAGSRTIREKATMSGRPTASDSRARAARFLTLVAEGLPADEAAKQANLGPWKALRIVSEASFLDVVRAIREGAGPVVAVVEAPSAQRAA